MLNVSSTNSKGVGEQEASKPLTPAACTAAAAAATAKLLQSCPTLCDPKDGSPPGFPSLGFSRQEHWSGLPFPSPMHESEKWKWKWSRVRLLATPWTAAYQAPPSMGFSRQKYWSGVPLQFSSILILSTHISTIHLKSLPLSTKVSDSLGL